MTRASSKSRKRTFTTNETKSCDLITNLKFRTGFYCLKKRAQNYLCAENTALDLEKIEGILINQWALQKSNNDFKMTVYYFRYASQMKKIVLGNTKLDPGNWPMVKEELNHYLNKLEKICIEAHEVKRTYKFESHMELVTHFIKHSFDTAMPPIKQNEKFETLRKIVFDLDISLYTPNKYLDDAISVINNKLKKTSSHKRTKKHVFGKFIVVTGIEETETTIMTFLKKNK